MQRYLAFVLLVLFTQSSLLSQITTSKKIEELTSSTREYEIGGIVVTGSQNLDPQVISLISGLSVGDKIRLPGEETTEALKNLWRQRLFDDIGIYVTEIRGNTAFLEIRLTELPKLSKYGIRGLGKSERSSLREEIDLSAGAIVTENLIVNTTNTVKKYFIEKGYLHTTVDIIRRPDTARGNSVILELNIERGEKVKINEILFYGNTVTKIPKDGYFDWFGNTEGLSDQDLYKAMKETKRKGFFNIFKGSKYKEEEYKADKKLIILKYNELGFRDARIVADSVIRVSDSRINIAITIEEGEKYYFRNIGWLGNTKYSSELLNGVLQIEKGDIYDASYLQERLFVDPQGADISSLYLDNGYLFFNLNPVEVLVENDSIDMEMRISEGRQATIRKVTVSGNDRTNDHVIMRELRTRPGELFRRSDIQRSMRELQQLGYFEPTELGVNPLPNAETGTVDIEYTLVERSTSQLELQGGWGAGRLVGTLGLNFNNFSARNIFNGTAWTPLPAGDGQTISLRAQSNGTFFQSYSASFTEPWLGGRKPNSLTVSLYYNIQNRNGLPQSNPNRISLSTTGVTIGLGRRLRWPDDYFTLYHALDFQVYDLRNYPLAGIQFTDGAVNNIVLRNILGRNSTDYPIYPRRGNLFSIQLDVTLPYSLLNNKDYSDLSDQDRYRWLEYYKWKINSSWFTEVLPKLVIKTAGEFGFMGAYNDAIGAPPFERYYLGGDGLQNFQFDGREIVGLRGYPNNSLILGGQNGLGGTVYSKFTMELRYLLTENPSAQIFMLGFLEAGAVSNEFDNFQPFELKRSSGFGVRVFMPMFGLLGVDFGYGYDATPNFPNTISGFQTHFTIGQQF